MSYDQAQKNNQVIFWGQEKCGGVFGNKSYDFVLKDDFAHENLYPIWYDEILMYFESANIKWWRARGGLPTNLTVATQIACLNHLYWLTFNQEACDDLVQSIEPTWHSVAFANGRHIEFEYNGGNQCEKMSLLHEKTSQRGVGSTCLNAAMLVQNNNGEKILLAIEWRYCEKYYQKAAAMDDDDPIYTARRSRLKPFLLAEDCPIMLEQGNLEVSKDYSRAFQKFSVEPFYSTMVSTLLAWQIASQKVEEVTGFYYVQVIPEENILLLNGETSREITQGQYDITAGWRNHLKEPEGYRCLDPRKWLEPIVAKYDAALYQYLHKRYWQ